jgi:hypothetical protein
MRPEALDRYFAHLRRLTALERAQIASRLSRAVRSAAEAEVRQRHPNASDDEVRRRLAVRMYGRAEAARVLGELPEDAT